MEIAKPQQSRSRRAYLIAAAFAGVLAPFGAARPAGAQRYAVAHAQEPPAAGASAPPGIPSYQRFVRRYTVPNVTLIDLNGAKVPIAAVLGSETTLFLNFIFTSCSSICPVMSAVFAEVQRQLAHERARVHMLSISIDPLNDDPEALRAYARKHGAGPNWRFLTGDVSSIDAVQKAFEAYRGNKMSHAPLTLLRASPRRPWVRIEGLVSAADLIAEYRRALSERD
jgi:protein SCO1/2